MKKLSIIIIIAILFLGCSQINKLSIEATQGEQGRQGNQGEQGETGDPGETGDQGPAGELVCDNLSGPTGPQENKKIIATNRFYCFQRKSYNYDREGLAQLDRLFKGIPEAEIEMMLFKENRKRSNLTFAGGLILGVILCIVEHRDAEVDITSGEITKKGSLGLPQYVSPVAIFLYSAAESGNLRMSATEHIKRAAMYYNSYRHGRISTRTFETHIFKP